MDVKLDLNCIPEESKSSDISSQKRSNGGQRQEDDFLSVNTRKRKPKRASDFKRIEA